MRIWSIPPDGKTVDLVRTICGQIEDGRAGQLFSAALSAADTASNQWWLVVAGYLRGPPSHRNAIRLHGFASGRFLTQLKEDADAETS